MAGPGNILIKVGADAGQAVRELSTVDKALGDTMTHSEKMGAGLKKAALPAAAALAGIAVVAVGAAKAAMEDAAAQEHLAGVLQRTTGATDAQVAATEDWISKLALATGTADDELRPALEKIAVATGDVSKAQDLMGAALDIAAASGKDVETVSAAIAKGYTGQTAALSKLVPGLSEASKKSKDFDTIMGELATKTGGAAAESATTAAGQYKIFQVQMSELTETLGAALLPVIDALLPLLRSAASLAAENTGAIKVLVGIVAALAAGILIANAAMKAYAAGQIIVKAATAAWTAAQWLLNAALDANPIGLVILAVAALAAGLVIAYTRSATFRAIVTAALDAVAAAAKIVGAAFSSLLGAAQSAFNWIGDHWKVGLFAFGPIGAAVLLIIDNFDRLKSAAKATFDAIASAIAGISSAIQSVIDKVGDLIGAIGRIHVPHINLPGPFLAPAGAGAGVGARSSAPSPSIVINVTGAIDPEGTARAIERVLQGHARRQGRP